MGHVSSSYVTYRGTEYYKVYSIIKALGEEELRIKEGKILEYFSIKGFSEVISRYKCYDALDARIQGHFANFTPPPKKPSPQLRAFEEKVSKLKEKYTTKLLSFKRRWTRSSPVVSGQWWITAILRIQKQ